MKLDNKGLTLIELIISVVLISVIMLFMYSLLNDINNDNNENSYSLDNSVIRSEIIKKVGNDFLKQKIKGITDESTADTIKIRFLLEDDTTSTMEITKTTIIYTNKDGVVQKWTMNNSTLNNQKATVKYQKTNSDTYTLLITIFVYSESDFNNENNNNVFDDIIISHIGDKEIPSLPTCLGNGC